MFIGHFGVGFGAKAAAPRLSLGSLLLAAQFLDLLWPTLLLLGIERVVIAPGATAVTPLIFQYYPYSHSLASVLVWGLLFALLFRWKGHDLRSSALVGGLVVSHWLLDAIVHQPDLPLLPGTPARFGLGLWASLYGSLAIELSIFALGAWLYARTTRPLDEWGRWGWWGLVALLLVIHAGNLFGPPPPSVEAIGWVGEAQWLLVAWGYWLDRHRTPVVAG